MPPRRVSWATVGLLALYLAAISTAFFDTGFVRATRSERFRERFAASRPQSSWPLGVEDIRRTGVTNLTEAEFLAPCLVANFPNAQAATNAFTQVSSALDSRGRATLVGQTLFLSGVSDTTGPDAFEGSAPNSPKNVQLRPDSAPYR
jgi:hypothetical protein